LNSFDQSHEFPEDARQHAGLLIDWGITGYTRLNSKVHDSGEEKWNGLSASDSDSKFCDIAFENVPSGISESLESLSCLLSFEKVFPSQTYKLVIVFENSFWISILDMWIAQSLESLGSD
jgi:hypothetical protein